MLLFEGKNTTNSAAYLKATLVHAIPKECLTYVAPAANTSAGLAFIGPDNMTVKIIEAIAIQNN